MGNCQSEESAAVASQQQRPAEQRPAPQPPQQQQQAQLAQQQQQQAQPAQQQQAQPAQQQQQAQKPTQQQAPKPATRQKQQQPQAEKPKPKLYYFDVRGLGEVVRMILTAGGVKFDDVRVPFDFDFAGNADWQKLKPNTPFGTLPVLEVDGIMIGESDAVSRYAAELAGLAGQSDVEAALIDAIATNCKDLLMDYNNARFIQDETVKKEQVEAYVTKKLPTKLETLEKLLKANNGGNGYFFGNKLSWADLQFHACTEHLSEVAPSALSAAPHLAALRARVAALPGMVEYLAARPHTAL